MHNEFNRDVAESLFKMAGFKIILTRAITNQYDPYNGPWFLIQTEFGVIMMGWRKHVINIDWSFCEYRGIITQDTIYDEGKVKVSTDENWTHAWSYEKALEYLSTLYRDMKKSDTRMEMFK